MPSQPSQRSLNALRARRLAALRRHAVAIGVLIDGVEPEDIETHRPGDIVQLLSDQPNAHALMRVTSVRARDQLRGYLLAASHMWRAGMRLGNIAASRVRKIGNSPLAIEIEEYPLLEACPLSFEQAAEASRLGWIAADEEKRARREQKRRERRTLAL